MKKKDFIKLQPEYVHEYSKGSININSIERLPDGVLIVEDINEFIGYNNRVEPNIVYFTKNIEGIYYIEITTADTNLEALEEYIKLKLVFA